MSETVLVIANDAGGANLVASWCAENVDKQFVYCISGPAELLFSDILGDIENHSLADLEMLITGVDRVVCATGEIPAVVNRTILLARQHGVPSAAFIDHWIGYRLRFTRSKLKLDDLPDEVWVTDEYAAAQAISEGFPASVVSVKGSPYVARVARSARELGAGMPTDRKVILFISEPIVNVPELSGGLLVELGFNEYQLMEDTIVAADDAGIKTIVIRLHPSESVDLYEDLLGRLSTGADVVVSIERDLTVDLARSIAVVGSNSTALVIAAEAGIKAISYIPVGGRPCVLPHTTIKKVRSRSVLTEELRKLY